MLKQFESSKGRYWSNAFAKEPRVWKIATLVACASVSQFWFGFQWCSSVSSCGSLPCNCLLVYLKPPGSIDDDDDDDDDDE